MKKPHQVSLHVQQPSVVELTVAETVVMDRLTPTAGGYIVSSRGELLIPGPTTLTLERGLYCFEAVSEARLRILVGDADAVTMTSGMLTAQVPRHTPPGAYAAFGDETTSEAPAFTLD